MWNKPIVKFFRWLVYIPLHYFLLLFIQWGFSFLLENIPYLTSFWLWLMLGSLAILAWFFIMRLWCRLMRFVLQFCPNLKIGSIVSIVITGLFFIDWILYIWTLNYTSNSDDILSLCVGIFLILALGGAIVTGTYLSAFEKEKEEDEYFCEECDCKVTMESVICQNCGADISEIKDYIEKE